MTDAIVIGGGVVGAATAFRLAQTGASVTLLEAQHLSAGTSGSSFAWTNANKKTPFEYFFLNVSGMGEHRRLRQELGSAPWFHENGHITWADTAAGWEKLDANVERLRGWGYPGEYLSRADVATLEPDLVLPDGVERAVHYPTEGHIDVPVLVGGLITAARRAGAVTRIGARVTEIETAGGKVTGVVTEDGGRLAADVVISCAGRWSDEVMRAAGIECPMAPSVGLIAVSTPTTIRINGLVHSPVLSLKSDGAGRVMMRGVKWDDTVDAATPTSPVPEACQPIFDEALRYLPDLAGARVEAARIGVRPVPADKKPLVGPVPGIDGLFLAVMHSGVTMGPLIGRMLATEIASGVMDPRLEQFRPERLVASGVAA